LGCPLFNSAPNRRRWPNSKSAPDCKWVVQNSRSTRLSFGRGRLRFRTATCWRKARISRARYIPSGQQDLPGDPSVYLLPARDLIPDLEKSLKRFCKTIFEEQLDGYRLKELWPKDRGIRAFKEWFEYRFHSMPIDLAREPLDWEEF